MSWYMNVPTPAAKEAGLAASTYGLENHAYASA